MEQKQQASKPPEEDEEPLDEEQQRLLKLIERKYGKELQELKALTQAQMMQQYQQQQIWQRVSQFVLKEQEYAKQNPDYPNAVNFLLDKLRAIAQASYPDRPDLQQQYIEEQRLNAMHYSPEWVYQTALSLGFQTAKTDALQSPGGFMPPAKKGSTKDVKTIAEIAGGRPGRPDNLDAKIDAILNMDLDDIDKIDPKELNNILKRITP